MAEDILRISSFVTGVILCTKLEISMNYRSSEGCKKFYADEYDDLVSLVKYTDYMNDICDAVCNEDIAFVDIFIENTHDARVTLNQAIYHIKDHFNNVKLPRYEFYYILDVTEFTIIKRAIHNYKSMVMTFMKILSFKNSRTKLINALERYLYDKPRNKGTGV